MVDVRDAHGVIQALPVNPDYPTGAKQDAMITHLLTLLGYTDGIEGLIGTGNTALSAILAKLIAAPSTEAKQDLLYALLGGGVPQAAVTGNFVAVGNSAHYIPLPRRAFNVTIWGVFVATLQVQASYDAGVNYVPVTAGGVSFTDTTIPGASQFEDTEGTVRYRLACISWTSGTVNYRISQ